MKFIALMIALGFLQYWGSSRPLHRDQWFHDFLARCKGFGLDGWGLLLVGLLIPVLLLLLLLDLSSGWLFGLPVLGVNILVLLFSFGRGDFHKLVDRYRQYCKAGDFEAAFLFAREELEAGSDRECPSAEEKLHRWMKERIAYLGFERWFAVIFYFVLLGAPGALAYRLLQLSSAGGDEQSASQKQVMYWVDWLPARALVFAFAVTGDWVGSRDQLKTSLADTRSSNASVLSDSAHAALGLKTSVFSDNGDVEAWAQISDWEIGELYGLLTRSAIAWVVVLSLVVLLA